VEPWEHPLRGWGGQHGLQHLRPRFTAVATVARDVVFGMTFSGREGIRAYFEQVLSGISDFREDIMNVIDVKPGTIVASGTYSGTFRDDVIVKPFKCSGTSVITMRDGKVSSNTDYYSAERFLSALEWVYPTIEAPKSRTRPLV
jgi:ketosteroid isomerase-like protein